MPGNTPRTAAARKIQKIFRAKRVFTNSVLNFRLSKSSITAQIVTFKLPTNFKAVFATEPKGFGEITGYKDDFRKPVVRWVAGRGWIGDEEGVKKIIAKKGRQTIVLTDSYFEVLGVGNYEAALLAIVKNGWAPPLLLKAPPTYKKIDGIFYVNRKFNLEDLKNSLRAQLPASMVDEVRYVPEVGLPTTILKLKKPKWTYQFFENGTIIFTGIKDPADIEVPKELFKNFFTEYGVVPLLVMEMGPRGTSPLTKPQGQKRATKKAALANRYNLASSWNAKPPRGFYVRPGTNGKPRFYPYMRIEKIATNIGEAMPHVNIRYHPMNLKGVAPKVVKAFANAGVPIPKATMNAFAAAGHPLQINKENRKSVTAPANRRAPSWNAAKPGFYVRPGPGKQPYWFKIPKGLAAGRKTVIKTYAEAGRNIPAAVREIFKIPANVKTNVVQLGNEEYKPGLKHNVKMGLNRVLRINNRQATRLTKAELLAIARNMNIPQANAKMTPARLIALIQTKAGVTNKLNRTYDVLVNGTFYKFLNNGRVEKTSSEGVQTRRAWATIPSEEQNKIAKKVLPANLHAEYNTIAKANRFNTLRAHLASKKPAVAKSPNQPRPRTPTPSPANSNSNDIARFALEAEFATRLATNLGNLSRNGNDLLFMKVYNALPSGARGKPLKATVNRAYAKFVKNTRALRANESSKTRYIARITVPNWMPANKVQAYKNLVTNLMFQKPKPKVANVKAAIRSWINREVPRSPARAARTIENMVTGEIKHIPAYVPGPRKTPNIPKRSPPPKKSPKAKPVNKLKKEYALPANKTGLQNLSNALANLGLNTGPQNAYTWAGLVRAGLDPKFKKTWLNKVAKN